MCDPCWAGLASFSTFSDAHSTGRQFEAQLTADRTGLDDLLDWIIKLKARFLSGDLRRGARGSRHGQGAALDLNRPDPVTRLLYYTALTDGRALYENDCRRTEPGGSELPEAPQEQLREWPKLSTRRSPTATHW